MKLLNKLFKKKQEKWITAWYGNDLLRVRESAFIKNAIVVKDSEGNYRAIRGRKK